MSVAIRVTVWWVVPSLQRLPSIKSGSWYSNPMLCPLPTQYWIWTGLRLALTNVMCQKLPYASLGLRFKKTLQLLLWKALSLHVGILATLLECSCLDIMWRDFWEETTHRGKEAPTFLQAVIPTSQSNFQMSSAPDVTWIQPLERPPNTITEEFLGWAKLTYRKMRAKNKLLFLAINSWDDLLHCNKKKIVIWKWVRPWKKPIIYSIGFGVERQAEAKKAYRRLLMKSGGKGVALLLEVRESLFVLYYSRKFDIISCINMKNRKYNKWTYLFD